MRRRDFIGGVLSSATVSPLPALAEQQGGRVRLIGALTGIADDSETKARYAAFRQELQRLGWIDGQNVRIDARFGEGGCLSHSQTGSGTGRALAGRYSNDRRSGDR